MSIMEKAHIGPLYRHSLALLTDLYQLTMAFGYWKSGIDEHEAVYHLTFRASPFGGGYALACGLHTAVELLDGLRFGDGDLEYLATVTGSRGRPLFDGEFLEHLRGMEFTLDVDAVPEGTVVFPHEPLVRVRGPILQCQLVETMLLNTLNFETLIATKAARICRAARGEPVLEFGLRRAQGIDGGVTASRAAYVGGCDSTSNVLAGKLFGIPVKGTHAHSWVMCFDSEFESFERYAEAMPDNCVFLVDTYDTLEGVRKAAEVGARLRERGHELVGVRLDSGDLGYLSVEARKILDRAGFEEAVIVASNELDEYTIESLKRQGAAIGVWGVGTRLATAYDQPALGGVYKLSAIRPPGGSWQHKVKLSEQAVKVSNPGIQQVRRFFAGGEAVADAIFDELLGIEDSCTIVDPVEPSRRTRIPRGTQYVDLLVPVFEKGDLRFDPPALEDVRRRSIEQIGSMKGDVARIDDPRPYPVGLEERLHAERRRLVAEARGGIEL